MKPKLVQFLDKAYNHHLFPIVGLIFVLSLLLLFILGPDNFFDLGQLSQRKADQVSEASEEAALQESDKSDKGEVYLIPEAKKTLSSLSQQARFDALENPVDFYPDQGAILALEDEFQIFYIEEDDRFVIQIEEDQIRLIAENYFVQNIVKTQDKAAICELDVEVAVYRGTVSKLSFC